LSVIRSGAENRRSIERATGAYDGSHRPTPLLLVCEQRAVVVVCHTVRLQTRSGAACHRLAERPALHLAQNEVHYLDDGRSMRVDDGFVVNSLKESLRDQLGERVARSLPLLGRQMNAVSLMLPPNAATFLSNVDESGVLVGESFDYRY
jgi:hypothetical protein